MISLIAFFLLELITVLSSSLSIYYVLPFIAHCFSTTDTCGAVELALQQVSTFQYLMRRPPDETTIPSLHRQPE